MHRLPSPSVLRQFKLATLLLFLFFGALLAFVGFGVAAIMSRDSSWAFAFLVAGIAVPVFGLVYLAAASRARCPLCMNPPLARRRCQKHRKAKRLFGSYRLRVGMGMLFNGTFTCPYCGEATRLEVRDRHRRR